MLQQAAAGTLARMLVLRRSMQGGWMTSSAPEMTAAAMLQRVQVLSGRRLVDVNEQQVRFDLGLWMHTPPNQPPTLSCSAASWG
jgi:hypothetical protein